jgi:hypothetical protein
MERKRSMGCAPHFRPTYAEANVGHPSISYDAAMARDTKHQLYRGFGTHDPTV